MNIMNYTTPAERRSNALEEQKTSAQRAHDGAERFARRVWAEVALLDMQQQFSPLTPENFEAADAFRVAHMADLLAVVGLR